MVSRNINNQNLHTHTLFILGFGSTLNAIIQANGTHYDCGCVLTENGDLLNQTNKGALSVPAVYVAYFSTFGAMVRLARTLFHSISSIF